MKLYIDVRPERTLAQMSEFNEEYVEKLLKFTEVETSIAFDENDTISLIVLNAVHKLLQCLREHGIDGRIGVIYNYSNNYPGWLLIVDTDNVRGSINPLVAQYFNWDRFESQSILTLDEIIENQ